MELLWYNQASFNYINSVVCILLTILFVPAFYALHYITDADYMCSSLILRPTVLSKQGGLTTRHRLTSFWMIVSSKIFGVTVLPSVIWLSSLVSLYTWYNLSIIFMRTPPPLFITCTIFTIPSTGPMEWLLSRKCWANFDFPLWYLQFLKCSLNPW